MQEDKEDKKETPLLAMYPQQEDMERGGEGEERHHHPRPLTKQEIALMLDALEDEAEMRYHERMQKQGLPCYPAFKRLRAGKEEEEDNTTTKDDKPVFTVCKQCAGCLLLVVCLFTLTYAYSRGFYSVPIVPNPCSVAAFHEAFGNKTDVNFLDIQLMHTNNDVLQVFATVDNYAQCKYIRKCLQLGTPQETFFLVACRVEHSRPVLGMIDFPDTSMYEIYD